MWSRAIAIVILSLIAAHQKADAQQPPTASESTVYLPTLWRGEMLYRNVPTAVLSPTPTSTGTPDVVGTIVAATLTAGAPTPMDTPLPSDTPDAVQTAVAATLTARAASPTPTPTVTSTPLPVALPTKTPTRYVTATLTPTRPPTVTPTRTATRVPACTNMLADGDFELSTGWRASNTAWAFLARANALMTPFNGVLALELHPPTSESVIALGNTITLPALDNLSAVRLSFQLQGHSLDRINNSDGFAAAIDRPAADGSPDPKIVFSQFNQSVVGSWRAHEVDILPQLKVAGWRRIEVIWFVNNDVTDNSWWYVDAAQLNVCTRP